MFLVFVHEFMTRRQLGVHVPKQAFLFSLESYFRLLEEAHLRPFGSSLVSLQQALLSCFTALICRGGLASACRAAGGAAAAGASALVRMTGIVRRQSYAEPCAGQ